MNTNEFIAKMQEKFGTEMFNKLMCDKRIQAEIKFLRDAEISDIEFAEFFNNRPHGTHRYGYAEKEFDSVYETMIA